jgi:DNA primase catalytic core
MGKIPQETVDRIKDAADIVEVIQDFVGLRKKGVNYVGICPFHADTTPSLYVSPAKQMFNCFACNTGGDVIKFVMEYEKKSYPEAMRYLAKKYGIDIPEVELSREEIERERRKESLIIILNRSQSVFESNLERSPEVQAYLTQVRGISAEILKTYRSGYALPEGNQLFSELTKAGYDPDLQIASGAVCRREERSPPRDQQRNRVTFPFFDSTGRIIGFTGRQLGDDKNTAKYLNTPETVLFHKGKILFGLYQAKAEIVRRDEVILVEGQFDVLSLSQKGYSNTVCSSGTALTDEQVKLIARFTRNVTLIYDSDSAGVEATFKNIKILLSRGLKVRTVRLPEGEDPDSFARKMTDSGFASYLSEHKETFVHYFHSLLKEGFDDPYKKEEALKLICECISEVEPGTLRNDFIHSTAVLFEQGVQDIKARIKPIERAEPEAWKPGFYGVEEAVQLLQAGEWEEETCLLAFDRDTFLSSVDDSPVVYVHDIPEKTHIQRLRGKINTFHVNTFPPNEIGKKESKRILALKELVMEGFNIIVKDDEGQEHSFIDFYIQAHELFSLNPAFKGADIPVILERCAEIISCAEPTRRSANMKMYQNALGLPNQKALNDILKPFLAKRKDRFVLETQRLEAEANLFDFDPEKIPDYVLEDETMSKTYRQFGFYPLLNASKDPVAYMFKNQNGGGHSCISDFYMIPLLHVYSKEAQANKRVIQLNHLFLKKPKYVEWQSSLFANLGRINERLIDEGAFNFEGSLQQFKKIWRTMSYNFTYCRELRVFGQQPEEFFAFSNAILHESEGSYTIERMDDLGVVSHNGENYYAPAFSKIYSGERIENDPCEQDRHLIYKDIPENDRLSFDKWAALMNEVYRINDNGKWAVLFSILCAFRDYIYTHRKYFTSLFFIGPTGSGKTQIAESIRNLFMDANTPSFNLNTGTDAAFFMILERLRNVVVVMEEYNDNTISPVKFQGIKSATLDGEGKIKVKDMANKTMDSSKINAIPLLLGQEAAQQDDGALSNRCILCEVPYKPAGEFTSEETALFEELKKHERIGLCNVFVEILKLRPLIKKHFLNILSEETGKLREAVKINAVNTEGLTRVLNAVSLMTSICRFMEEYVSELRLPFTYREFFQIACSKVLKQMEMISSSNKLSTYFNTISFLLNQGSLKVGRELKVIQPGHVTRLLSGKTTEEVQLTPPETKVLYLNFETIYNAYHKSAGEREALSRSSLKTYFESNRAYIGFCKSTIFKWQVVRQVPKSKLDSGYADNAMRQVVEWEQNNTSAYMFDYDKLKDLMNIDFERGEAPEKEEEPSKPAAEASEEMKPPEDIPF